MIMNILVKFVLAVAVIGPKGQTIVANAVSPVRIRLSPPPPLARHALSHASPSSPFPLLPRGPSSFLPETRRTPNAPSFARAGRSFSLPHPCLLLDDDPSGWRKGPSFEERGG